MDFEEKVRKQVVAVIYDVACHDLNSIPLETVKLVAERLRDKSVYMLLLVYLCLCPSDFCSVLIHFTPFSLSKFQVLVKKYTMERLAEIYRVYCAKCSDGSTISSEFEWIPGKILRCFYDKDFR